LSKPKKGYYKSKLIRALLYSTVFILVVYIVTQTGLFGDAFMPSDLRIYFGFVLLEFVALIIVHTITSRHRYFRRR